MKIIMKKVIQEMNQPVIVPEKGEKEIWKKAKMPVESDKYQYRVSNFGNVERLVNGKWEPQKLTMSKGRKNYMSFYIKPKSKTECIGVHQLVCEAFNGPAPFEDYTPDHIDECEYNNYYKNLEWISPSEQKLRSYKSKKQENKKRTGNRNRAVGKFTKDGEFIKMFKSAAEAGRSMGKKDGKGVFESCNSTKTRWGYHWAYLDVCEVVED